MFDNVERVCLVVVERLFDQLPSSTSAHATSTTHATMVFPILPMDVFPSWLPDTVRAPTFAALGHARVSAVLFSYLWHFCPRPVQNLRLFLLGAATSCGWP